MAEGITWFVYGILITGVTADLALASLLVVRRQLSRMGAYRLLDRLGRIVTVLYFVPVMFTLLLVRHLSFTPGYTSGMRRVRGDVVFGTEWQTCLIAMFFLIVWTVVAVKRVSGMRERRAVIRRMLSCDSVCLSEQQARLDEVAHRIGIERPVELRRCLGVDSAMAWGIRHPVVILDKPDHSDRETEVIFIHELIHIKRGDLLFRFLLDLAECIFWFCPMVHRLPPLQIQWSEICTDIRAGELAGGVKDYFSVILTMVSRSSEPVCNEVCMIGGNGIEERVIRVRDYQKGRKRKGNKLILSAICAVMALFCSVTALAAGEGVAAIGKAASNMTKSQVTDETADPRVNDGVEYTAGPRESDENVIVENVIEEYYGTFKPLGWTVEANYVSETPLFWATKDGYIRLSMEVDPADVVVYIGIIEPNGSRRYCVVQGELEHKFALTKTGGYKVYVENPSQTTDINVYGGYFFE